MTKPAAAAGATSEQYLEMSDEDFLRVNPPSAPATPDGGAAQAAGDGDDKGAASATDAPSSADFDGADQDTGKEGAQDVDEGSAAEKDQGPAAATEELGADSDDTGADTDAGDKQSEATQAEATGSADADAAKPDGDPAPAAGDKATDKAVEPGAKDASQADDKTDKEPPKAEGAPVNYEAFFKQVMAPFKANGRTIELKTPEEAIRLMQMGAGYGRKIQDLQPHLKVLRMLEKNELLDEGKLSFLIDLNAKNPEAIKKVIKDAGIDPLDLNTEDNANYIPKNHSVSDQEMAFHNALQDIQSHEGGQETLRLINQTWDPQSKSLLWESPEILGVIQSQRDTGVYDQIAAEIDRQKTLGVLPSTTPFLQAYKTVGDQLMATGGLKPPANKSQQIQTQTEAAPAPQPHVIATRPAAPKPQVQNGDKAAAAAPTRTASSRKPANTVNPLEMADDDFLKQFQGRL